MQFEFDFKPTQDYIAVMKTLLTYSAWLFLLAITAPSLAAQIAPAGSGFVDANRDGVNDLFTDADGNGINDVTGASYPHHFKFADADGDRVNDLWVDSDGDGVNDLLAGIQARQMHWVDIDGDGIAETQKGALRGRALKEHVLDTNRDGLNDITGEAYSGRTLSGYKYGNVHEELGLSDSDFIDANGDGMNDHFSGGKMLRGFQRGQRDLFIDRDGDGIADDRGIRSARSQRGRQGRK